VYLKRLEIQGFKTFASRTVFEFRPGITAIVGPNGSGKSNISDAMRWVLGEQSYAVLRSKRTEDLIFSGGGRRAPAGLAEVSLIIDNSDRLLPLPYGEVTISRRATRSGENEYFINRSRVRLRDIHEAIGPLGGSYTIINQGLVDAALTLRPEERRRLFEDAAEISAFESRKAETERRLRETNANMDRCADMLAELEPRLRSLKRQAGVARTHGDLTGELHALLMRHYAERWRTAQRALADTEAAEQQVAADLQIQRARQTSATTELRRTREELRALRDRLGELHAESSTLHTRAESTQRELAVGNERQAALARRGEEFERGRREFDLRHEELEHERAAVVARLGDAEAGLAEQRAVAAAREGALIAREEARRAARRTLEAAQRAELEATAALTEQRRQIEQLARRRERLTEAQAGSAETLDAAEHTLATAQAALAVAQEKLAEAEGAHSAATTEAERAGAELERLRSECTRADEAIAVARRVLADTETRLETLTRLQRSYAGAFAGVKAAMQWAEANGRTSFALVASLLRTPAHLETAIEVALGSRLQNIVVPRWSDAEDAIAALKRGGQGRATFLPLDTLRRPAGAGAAAGAPDDRRGDAVLGIASELVDYDDHYRPAVDYLLGRTLIVRDLATARQELARRSGGWTLVTLAGEQVSSGGAVTGGAQTRESGALRRERELRELPEQVATQQQAVAERMQARGALGRRVSASERALHEAAAQRKRSAQAREALHEAQAQSRRALERAETELDLQRRRHAQASADIVELDAQASTLGSERTTWEAREAAAREQLTRLRAAEQERAAEEDEAQRELNELRAAAAAIEGEVQAARALIQSHDQNLARLAEQHVATTARIAELARERAALEEQLHALDESHAGLLAQIDELRALIGPAEAELAALEAAQADMERREAELTGALIAGESLHGRAAVEVQRARDRLTTLWERAAADDIDIEALDTQPASSDDAPTAGDAHAAVAADAGSAPQSPPDLAETIERLRERIRRLGVVNPLALEEYEEAAERHSFLTTQLDDLRRAETALRDLIAELDEAMQARFEATFQAVAAEFERSFTRLFGGGQAQLLLTRSNDSDEEHDGVATLGVEILARPPGKRQQTLALLSGGERSLTASALLFAILKVNPSPFCILDEVDAALDEANVGRFREALGDLAEQTQFLLVTHNRGTIEAAETIYGVSMGEDGASKVLSLRLEELVT
jgi:chromosome segregation protein